MDKFEIRLKDVRKEKHLTLKNVSEKTGLSISFISEVERGRREPSLGTLMKLAEACEVPFDQIFVVHNPPVLPARQGVEEGTGADINRTAINFEDLTEKFVNGFANAMQTLFLFSNVAKIFLDVVGDAETAQKFDELNRASEMGNIIENDIRQLPILSNTLAKKTSERLEILREQAINANVDFNEDNVKKDVEEEVNNEFREAIGNLILKLVDMMRQATE